MSKIVIVVILLVVVFLLLRRGSENKKIASENRQAGVEFLAANKANDGIMTTGSGLQYMIIAKGSGTVYPRASDKVNVHYHGTLINGTVFDSSVERGEPISFGLNQVIKGWYCLDPFMNETV